MVSSAQTVLAQAPVNDVISWPSGLLLLATALYAALGSPVEQLWEIEPSSGISLFSGLPLISIPLMQRVTWVANTCHFIPDIRAADGVSNFWIRANDITASARAKALQQVMKTMHCVLWEISRDFLDEPKLNENIWKLTSAGLICSATQVASNASMPSVKPSPPVARDFLLFAATRYHAIQHWVVDVRRKGVVFSTLGMPFSSVADVESEDDALAIVAAQMVRRPHSQSSLRAKAQKIMDPQHEHYFLNLDKIDLDAPICSIDFHSYAPERSKVAASLRELAHAYYVVVQHIKRSRPPNLDCRITGHIARVNVGQTLWIAILGGAVLDNGRLTIQNLPGKRDNWRVSADHAYLMRVETVLDMLQPVVNTPAFEAEVVFSGGINRRSAIPFFIAGLLGQMLICYFLSIGTSAGVWTSVVLANSLYAGKLNDWHSIYWGKSEQPGLKMRVPGSKKLMCLASFDRSSPVEGHLRQGFLLNVLGLIAATFGAIYQFQTRQALGFSPLTFTPNWVVYTSIGFCVGTSILIAVMLTLQHTTEKTWSENQMLPTRLMTYCTLPTSLVVAGLAVLFRIKGIPHFWPILDALTWISGMPLGMIENGRIFSMDDNIMHLVLINRWMMGAVASAVGSSAPANK